jgi:hypothetical protein
MIGLELLFPTLWSKLVSLLGMGKGFLTHAIYLIIMCIFGFVICYQINFISTRLDQIEEKIVVLTDANRILLADSINRFYQLSRQRPLTISELVFIDDCYSIYHDRLEGTGSAVIMYDLIKKRGGAEDTEK